MERFKLVCFYDRKKNNVREFIFDSYKAAYHYREFLKATDKKFIQDWSYISTIYY